MNRTVKKIVLVLIIIILLPGLFFTAYEINQIKESEQVLEGVYNNQLDGILFSVNQYSQDIVSGWRSTINTILIDKYKSLPEFKVKIDSFLNINTSISAILFTDSIQAKKIYPFPKSYLVEKEAKNIREFIMEKRSQIKKLYTYKKMGYFKIEPLPVNAGDSLSVFLFLSNDPNQAMNICLVVINPEKFIKNVLGPRINSITENELIITCTEVNTNRIIASTGEFNPQEILQKKSLWLLPNYELGILPKGKTVEEILKERTNTSIILISILTGILLTGVFIVFRNIRREVELAQIKSDFVSNVSHELRTPLALITMFAETLELGRVKTEEKKQEYYIIISREANRLSRIVNKILSFSKIEAGKRQYHFSRININKIADDVFSSYQFHLNQSGFKVCLEKDNDMPEISADGEAISEALLNLIDNSVKYSGNVKEINIITGIEKNTVFIEVSDKGIGISEEDQKKIFEKFYRVSEGLVHNTKGTGLGLTLVKHIVEAHHGEIKLKSKPGEGSSFKMIFPVSGA